MIGNGCVCVGARERGRERERERMACRLTNIDMRLSGKREKKERDGYKDM